MTTRVFFSSVEELQPTLQPSAVVSIIGPTGTGKTSAALVLGEALRSKGSNPLLVSVDSVSAYTGLDVGSAKPLGKLRSAWDWCGIDVFLPTEESSVAAFFNAVAPQVFSAHQEGRPILFVGGSHFYEQRFVRGAHGGGPSDPDYQDSLNSHSNEDLWNRLQVLDADFARKLHVNDRYRISRALDLVERQGLRLKQIELQQNMPWSEVLTLDFSHKSLQETYKPLLLERIQEMFAAGWISEVRKLLESGVPPTAKCFNTVGYREVLSYVRGELAEQELVPRVLTSHLQLAKKQRTWIRGLR